MDISSLRPNASSTSDAAELDAVCARVGSASPGSRTQASRPPERRAANNAVIRHPMVCAFLAVTDWPAAWDRWRAEDHRLGDFGSFGEVRRLAPDDARRYAPVAALANIGCRRGGDDDEAALAVVVLLSHGVEGLAAKLRDRCELDEVIVTVWERVKAAEPTLGVRAASFLLRRARSRILADTAGRCFDRYTDALPVDDNREATVLLQADAADAWLDAPKAELESFLGRAAASGAVTADDIAVLRQLLELERLGYGRVERNTVVGDHLGITSRSMFRREARLLERLREVASEFSADAA